MYKNNCSGYVQRCIVTPYGVVNVMSRIVSILDKVALLLKRERMYENNCSGYVQLCIVTPLWSS